MKTKILSILMISLLIVSLSFIGADISTTISKVSQGQVVEVIEGVEVPQGQVVKVIEEEIVIAGEEIVKSVDTSFLEACSIQDYTIKTETFSKDLFAKSYIESIEEPNSLEIQARNYIKNNPEIAELTIKAIMETIEESPELLIELLESNVEIGRAKISIGEDTKSPFIDKVSEKVDRQLIKEGKIKAVNIGQESVGVPDWLTRYLLDNLITSSDITIEMITDSEDGLSIKFIATSAGWFSTKIDTDYGTLGQVGEGWFTWPWKYGEFTAYFTGSRHSRGYHYIIVYPIIWRDIFGEDLLKWPEWVLAFYVRGFVINIADSSSGISIQPIIGNVIDTNLIIIPEANLEVGYSLKIKDYTIKPIKIEKPKFLKIIPIPWAKPQAEISISNGNEITTQIVKENSEFKLGEIEVEVGEIKDNHVSFNVRE